MATARISPATSEPARSQRRREEPGRGSSLPPVGRREPRHTEHVGEDVRRHRRDPDDEARLVEAQHAPPSGPSDDRARRRSRTAPPSRGRGPARARAAAGAAGRPRGTRDARCSSARSDTPCSRPSAPTSGSRSMPRKTWAETSGRIAISVAPSAASRTSRRAAAAPVRRRLPSLPPVRARRAPRPSASSFLPVGARRARAHGSGHR